MQMDFLINLNFEIFTLLHILSILGFSSNMRSYIASVPSVHQAHDLDECHIMQTVYGRKVTWFCSLINS